MILERVVYALLAALFFGWAFASVRSGESRLIYSAVKRSKDALIYWVGVVTTALVGVAFVWLVLSPMPLGWPYKS